MTLASLFRLAPVTRAGGRHAAPDTGEDRLVAVLDGRPGRHAAPEDDDPTGAATAEVAGEVPDEAGGLLDSLGFGYDD